MIGITVHLGEQLVECNWAVTAVAGAILGLPVQAVGNRMAQAASHGKEYPMRHRRLKTPPVPPIPGSEPKPEPDPEPPPGSAPDVVPPVNPEPEPGSTPDVVPPRPEPAPI
jgi:hypothetical protein